MEEGKITNEEIDGILRQPIISWEQNKIERAKNAEKFIFSYLIKRGGNGKVYELLLKENGFNLPLKSFLKDIEFYTVTTPLINILKQGKNKATLELTLSGELFYKDKSRIEVKIPSYFFRLKVFIKNRIKNFWEWLKNFDKIVKRFWKSGIVVIIVYILGNLTKFDFFTIKNSTQEKTQQVADTNRKLKYFQIFSDSLLKEIKKKELKIKEYEQAQKDSALMNENDSLPKK